MSAAFIIKKCCNKTVFIVLSAFIIKKCCNNALVNVKNVYYLIFKLFIQPPVYYRGFKRCARDVIRVCDWFIYHELLMSLRIEFQNVKYAKVLVFAFLVKFCLLFS